MNIEMTSTVGDIASEHPFLIPLLEEMKIDYCCGGARSLKEACALAGVPVERASASLRERLDRGIGSVDPEADWKGKKLGELIDHILEKHHVFTRAALTRLRGISVKVDQVHGTRHPELGRIAELVYQMGEEMEGHMAKEEEQVFPYLKAVESAGGKKAGIPDPFRGGPLGTHPLKVLMWEHGMTGEEFGEIHRLSRDLTPPSDACGSYRALYRGLKELEEDLHRHVHLENNVLFQKAAAAGILD